MSNDYYRIEAIASGYDAEQASQAVTVDDIPFYVELARQAAASGQSVLELGCGTGRVTVPIAQAGIDVVGLDSSPEMLAVAAAKAEGLANVTWVEGDMSAFSLETRFGLVIIPFRSFLMLLTKAEQTSCLACIREHLVANGRLAFNFFNPELAMRSASKTSKRGAQKRHSDTSNDAGALVVRMERNLRLRYVFREEMEQLLKLSGFEVEALYGWFDGRPFDAESSEMVWVARRC